MSTVPAHYLDDSELLPEEQPQWGARVYESLKAQYTQRIVALYRGGRYANDEAGWQQLYEDAWIDTVSTNAVCREITDLSAARRARRESGGEDASTFEGGQA